MASSEDFFHHLKALIPGRVLLYAAGDEDEIISRPYLSELLDFESSTSNNAACLALMYDHADLAVKLAMLVLVLKVILNI